MKTGLSVPLGGALALMLLASSAQAQVRGRVTVRGAGGSNSYDVRADSYYEWSVDGYQINLTFGPKRESLLLSTNRSGRGDEATGSKSGTTMLSYSTQKDSGSAQYGPDTGGYFRTWDDSTHEASSSRFKSGTGRLTYNLFDGRGTCSFSMTVYQLDYKTNKILSFEISGSVSGLPTAEHRARDTSSRTGHGRRAARPAQG